MKPVLSLAVQFGGGRGHPVSMSLLEPFALVAFVICSGAVGVPLLGLLVSGARGALRAFKARRRRLRLAASAEMRARAMMSEMCPHGWRAEITILDGESALEDSERARGDRVAVDWAELEGDGGRPAVMRRVWAPTIGEALDAMVADRRTDQTLEQIEQGAVADGALWPDR